MDTRTQKQVIIAIFFLGILFFIGGGFYFVFRSPASCFDKIQNQGEEDIDCGGPCATACEEKELKPLETAKTYFFSSRENFYDAAVRIRNLNLRYGAKSFSYTFKLIDGAGNEIGQKSGKSFILPGQSKYVIEPLVEAKGKPARVSFSYSDEQWERLEDFGELRLSVKNKFYSRTSAAAGETGFSKAEGTVFNDTPYDFDKIGVNVVLLGENNAPIAINKTEMRTLIAGEERYFKVIWFYPFEGDVKNVEAEAETNVFLQETFLKRFGE